MSKTILTLDELFRFCQTTGMKTFSADQAGAPIKCRVNTKAKFASEAQDGERDPGLIYCTVKVCHTLKNRNKSFISEDAMVKAMPTIIDRPVLAYIHQLDDGTWDFWAHNMEIKEDDDGELYVDYLETQVGNFSNKYVEPSLQYDENEDKTYLVAQAAIPTDYSKAVEIIERRGGECDVSCELSINAMSYDKKNDYLNIEDFHFTGLALLGKDDKGNVVQPGMEGAKLTVGSVVSDDSAELGGDGQTFEHISTNENSGGKEDNSKPMSKEFKDILEKYGKAEEDITFDYSAMTEAEFEAECEKLFADEDGDGIEDDQENPGPTGEDGGDEGENEPEIDDDEASPEGAPKKKKYSQEMEFSLSHGDIDEMIWRAVDKINRDNDWNTSNCVASVFDDYFVYTDWRSDSKEFTAQKYTKTESGIELVGDPYPVFVEYLTADQKAALDSMKTEFESLKEFKANIDATEAHAAREAVLNSEDYAILVDDEEFVDLKNNIDNYSVDELQTKADLIFAQHIKKTGTFSRSESAQEDNTEKKNTLHFSMSTEVKPEQEAYPGLFKD